MSIALDSTNKINEIQIVQIIWGKENESEIKQLQIVPDNLQEILDSDIKKITKM